MSAKPAQETSPPTLAEQASRPAHPEFFPFHIVPGISNFRDIGGWPVYNDEVPPKQTGHVRRGILYRGSDTNRVTKEGEATLRKLRITTDFDLRSKQQIEKLGGYKEIQGIERKWAPVFKEEDYTEEAAKKRYELYAEDGTEGIVEAFVEILIAGGSMFRTVLRHLLAAVPPHPSPAPALFMHCTTGNNRSGVFIIMLLLLLGVPHETIAKEYTLSDAGLAPTRHMNIERLLAKGAFEEYGPEEARRKCERMVGARAESAMALIDEVKIRWGGPEEYFKSEVGLTDQELEHLTKLLTVSDAA